MMHVQNIRSSGGLSITIDRNPVATFAGHAINMRNPPDDLMYPPVNYQFNINKNYMNQLNQQKTALTVALFVGGWHAIWSLLIAMGAGQAIYDFILWTHMTHLPVVVGPFDFLASSVLVVITFVTGYVFGFAFAYLWNTLHWGDAIIK
jgi:hypothetical protein